MNLIYTPRQAPQREPPITRTRRTDVQPSRSRVVDEEYVAPPRRTAYPTYYPRSYGSFARAVFTTAGAGYVPRPRPYPPRVYGPRPYPTIVTGQMYPRRPFMYPRRLMNPMGGSASYVR